MARGVYLVDDDKVLVDYGQRAVCVTVAQYRANGYRPPFDRLPRAQALGAVAAQRTDSPQPRR